MKDFLSKTLKNKKNKKKFTSLKCHPKNKSFKKSSCLDLDTLIMLKQFWNKRHPDCQIRTRKKVNIWNEIKQKMSDSCNHEMCWIDSVIPSNAKKKNSKTNYLFQKCQILGKQIQLNGCLVLRYQMFLNNTKKNIMIFPF